MSSAASFDTVADLFTRRFVTTRYPTNATTTSTAMLPTTDVFLTCLAPCFAIATSKYGCFAEVADALGPLSHIPTMITGSRLKETTQMAEEELHKTDADVSANDAADSNATVTDDVVVDAATDSEGDAVAVESETVTEEPQTDSEKKAEREEKRAEDNEKRAEEAAVVSEEEADDLSLDKIQAVLNSTIDEKDMSPQMRRMVKRQQENTKRVEESIKGTKANPSWFVPLFCAFMIVGLIWVVVFYMTAKYPIPGIGNWNLAVGFALIMIGFLMTVAWR